MKTRKRTVAPPPAATRPTDEEVRAIVFAWAKDHPDLEGSHAVIEIAFYDAKGGGLTVLTVATKDWQLHADGDPLPGIHGQAADGP